MLTPPERPRASHRSNPPSCVTSWLDVRYMPLGCLLNGRRSSPGSRTEKIPSMDFSLRKFEPAGNRRVGIDLAQPTVSLPGGLNLGLQVARAVFRASVDLLTEVADRIWPRSDLPALRPSTPVT